MESIGRGPPLVLLHGWGFHSGVWDGFAQALAERHEVHLFDLPGHGRSHEMAFEGLDPVVDELARRIPERSIVCGWSLGGLAAQRLASRHAPRVAGLALLATTPCFVSRGDWPYGVQAGTLERFGEDLRADPRATLRSFLNLNALASPSARVTVRTLTSRLDERPAPSPQALDAGLDTLRTMDLRNDAAAIEARTVVVHGARDRIVPPGAGAWLAATIQRARHVDLSDSAHLPFLTDREATLEAVQALHG